ncbi:hypothetical protein [Streptomyces sp. WAC07061]|nr:hypothetical protein [Streptomyces sp. WAC07061]
MMGAAVAAAAFVSLTWAVCAMWGTEASAAVRAARKRAASNPYGV